jgi:hypothetical protein
MTDGDSGLTTGAADCRDEDKDEGMDRPLRCVSSLLHLITCHSPKPTNPDKGRPQHLHEFVLDTTNSSCAQAQWERVQRRCRWSVVQCAEIQG